MQWHICVILFCIASKDSNMKNECCEGGDVTQATYSYTIAGRPDRSPWPAGGSWTFGSDIESQIVRDPGSDHELNISYTVTIVR